MKTVPSLCATATAVGVSAVGLSIGRPHSPSDLSHRRTQIAANELEETTTPAKLDAGAADSVRRKSPFASPFSDPGALERHGTTRRLKRRTSTDLHSSGNYYIPRTFSPLDDRDVAESNPEAAARSRPSWIKRLSTVSTQSSGRDHSSRAVSPSISCSNRSMAFSHAGSTAPIISTPSPTPLPPNKLVKRSTSLRAIDTPRSSGSSRRPTLRRPATSHQRSATLHHTTLQEHSADDSFLHELMIPRSGQPEVKYSKFFSARIAREKTVSKKRGSGPEVRPFRRILPVGHEKATLVLAKAIVATSTTELEELSSQDGDSVADSRSGTPELMEEQGRAGALTSTARSRSQDKSQKDSRTRRSFSIGHYLVSTPDQVKQRLGMSNGAKLQRRPSRRISSAPTVANASQVESDRAVPQPVITGLSSIPLTHQVIQRADGLPSTPPRPTSRAVANSNVPPMVGNSSDSSNTTSNSRSTGARDSTVASEQASTFVDSEPDIRGIWSGEEDDLDIHSDTLYDSIRTRATSGTSAPRGPRIDTIFDHPPTAPKSGSGSHASRDGASRSGGLTNVQDGFGNTSITEEDEDSASPGRHTVRGARDDTNGYDRNTSRILFPSGISSSPPDTPKPLSLGTLEWDAVAEEDDDQWSFSDEETDNKHSPSLLRTAIITSTPTSVMPRLSIGMNADGNMLRPRQVHGDAIDREARSSIFDWAEQRKADKSSGDQSPPRPSTVHGKKDTDIRGSRAMGRRAPSGLHARSQSVPVVPDIAGKRETVVTNKFGTWGVGSKGVTEDWNDDFDFEDVLPHADKEAGEIRVDSGFSMLVPKTIREQQTTVLANIGLLREWGLLIEELKELRIRAGVLGLLSTSPGSTWHEVDAMIELADQEAEEEPIEQHQSPSSSPEFDADSFDEALTPARSSGRTPQKAGLVLLEEPTQANTHLTPQSSRSRRKSIANKAIFEPTQTPPTHFQQKNKSIVGRVTDAPTANRPRKDSEAMALTVIETLRQRRTDPDFSARPPSPSKKVPFDTATLKHIVPYVDRLMKRVKADLRDREGLYSPGQSPQAHFPAFENPFAIGFRSSPGPVPWSRKERREAADAAPRRTNDAGLAKTMAVA